MLFSYCLSFYLICYCFCYSCCCCCLCYCSFFGSYCYYHYDLCFTENLFSDLKTIQGYNKLHRTFC